MDDDQDDLFTPRAKPKRRARKRRMKPERNLWREDEMLCMLDIFKDYKALELLNDKNTKGEEVFQDIEKEMSKMGYRKKNFNQIWTKWKFLKSTYTTSRRSNHFPNYLTLDVYQAIDNIMYKAYGSRSTLQPPNYMRVGGREESHQQAAKLQTGSAVPPAPRSPHLEPMFTVKEEPTEEEDQYEDLSFQEIEEDMLKKKVSLASPIPVRKLPKLLPKPTVKKEPQKKTPIIMPTLSISVKSKMKPIPIRRLEEPPRVQITPVRKLPAQASLPPPPQSETVQEEEDYEEEEDDPDVDDDEMSTIRHNEIVNNTNLLGYMTHEQFSKTMREMQTDLLQTFFKKQEELIKEEYAFQRQQDERLLKSFEQQNKCILEATKNILNGLTVTHSIQPHPGPVEQDHNLNNHHFMYFNGQ
ncbi:hypothetical protein ACFFRR_006258 [Megaselia abdita]